MNALQIIYLILLLVLLAAQCYVILTNEGYKRFTEAQKLSITALGKERHWKTFNYTFFISIPLNIFLAGWIFWKGPYMTVVSVILGVSIGFGLTLRNHLKVLLEERYESQPS